MSELSGLLKGAEGPKTAHGVVDFMGDHSITPVARNYEVWLNHKLGSHPDLCAAVDGLMKEGVTIDDAISASLYDQFFGGDTLSVQVMMTGEQIARELSGVVAALEAAGEKTGLFGATLVKAARRLEEGLDAKRLQEVIAGLASATLDMAEHTRKLNERLSDSSSEIAHLRSSLAKARAESMTDALTGLANRRYFDEVLRMRLNEARAQDTPLTLLMCDIDHFKRFNDTWGHQTGDQIIRFVAGALQKGVAADHLVARYGGEVFAVVMPRVRRDYARSFAEQIRRTVESKKLLRKSTNEDLGRVTVSLGIAELRASDDGHTLIARADGCLYHSKRCGRNRVTTDIEVRDSELSVA